MPVQNNVDGYGIFYGVLTIIAALLIAWILMRINKRIFREIQKNNKEGLHLIFFQRVISLTILIACIIIAFSTFGGVTSVWKTLLGGTAIISAVLAFAAQDVIKDILAGLMISIYKPFEIGDRIELDNGMTGVVKDISMRHVVMLTWDTQRLVIPNSKLNSMIILNDSYHADTRSIQFEFHIGYGSDVEKAQKVIREAIMDSVYTQPGKETEDGMIYGPVYFMKYGESSLDLATTAYYSKDIPSEIVKNDINMRVNRALNENGIEIPYNYINVVPVNGSGSG